MESDSTLRFGFKAPFKSISYTKKSIFLGISEALRDALAGPEALFPEIPCILYIISHQPFTANDAPFCSPIFFFHNRQKHSAINHLWTTMITQTSSSIYNYGTKIIASESKTIAVTTFAITNDTSELIFFSKSIFRIFQITLILFYNRWCAQYSSVFLRALCASTIHKPNES